MVVECVQSPREPTIAQHGPPWTPNKPMPLKLSHVLNGAQKLLGRLCFGCSSPSSLAFFLPIGCSLGRPL